MKRVIQLLRVSTEGQAADDRAGLAAQRAINHRTVATYGLEIVKTIEMSDVSGTAVLRAPEMQELLSLIKGPEIHGVVAKEFSRLLEAFFDGAIDRGERDERLAKVDKELRTCQEAVKSPPIGDTLSTCDLAEVLSTFAEMPFLQRSDKRALLNGVGLQAFVNGYRICTLEMRNIGGAGNTGSHLKTAP